MAEIIPLNLLDNASKGEAKAFISITHKGVFVKKIEYFLIFIFLAFLLYFSPQILSFLKSVTIEIKNTKEILLPNVIHTTFIGIAGLVLSLVLAIILAFFMDNFKLLRKAFYPIIYLSQLLPTIVIAPIYVLFFGYTILCKILVVISCCFFPIIINLSNALNNCDERKIKMIKNLGGNSLDIFYYLKLPNAIRGILSGLKISATFCIGSALVAEWLGGSKGIGIYMIIAKKGFNYEALWASTFIVIILSLLILGIVSMIEYYLINWRKI